MTAADDPATRAAHALLTYEETQPGIEAGSGCRDPGRLLARAGVLATIGVANQLAALTDSLRDAIAEGVAAGMDTGLTDLEAAVDLVSSAIDAAYEIHPRRRLRDLLMRRSP